MALLVALFIVIPLAELAVIARVADSVGLGDTIALLLFISLVGAAMVKREGLAAWSRLNQRLAAGELPGRELTDGAMVLVAGALLLTPGFLTDTVGFLLLLPPFRALARRVAGRWFDHRIVAVGGPGFRGPSRPGATRRGPVVDGHGYEQAPRPGAERPSDEIIDAEVVDETRDTDDPRW